ncbi:putative serine protease-like protein [Arabidopsis thaliana]|uniref:Putative serine protease-like protein n=1 Tax=Arabidopsis thaliana TaxID=3702 RepID=O23555_ARATH|nr:putative serine protease-like protein [Arabidopsis thaliana]CAB80981.1 putative serine protease-like protein [Arabidopsis thaliana]
MVVMMKATRGTRDPDLLGLMFVHHQFLFCVISFFYLLLRDFEFLLNDSSSGIWTWSQVVSETQALPYLQKAFNIQHFDFPTQEDQEENTYAAKVSEKQDFSKEQWQDYKRPASEQHYSDEVETYGNLEPSQLELSGLSEACNKLWELDLNRLVPGRIIKSTAEMGKGSMRELIWLKDYCSLGFCSLLDNYNPNEGYKEVVTEEERQEQAAFIEEISRTSVIKYLHRYLVLKDVAPGSYLEFKRMLTSLWFDLYGRGGTSGSSSAFEHVFVGEIKQSGGNKSLDSITGFSTSKPVTDRETTLLLRMQPDSETQLLTIQFEWNGVLKSVSSTLVGVSPEFELALYTMCFFMGTEDNHIQLGPYNVNVKCYRLGNNRIALSFPHCRILKPLLMALVTKYLPLAQYCIELL